MRDGGGPRANRWSFHPALLHLIHEEISLSRANNIHRECPGGAVRVLEALRLDKRLRLGKRMGSSAGCLH